MNADDSLRISSLAFQMLLQPVMPSQVCSIAVSDFYKVGFWRLNLHAVTKQAQRHNLPNPKETLLFAINTEFAVCSE